MTVFWAVTRCGMLGLNYLLPPNSQAVSRWVEEGEVEQGRPIQEPWTYGTHLS